MNVLDKLSDREFIPFLQSLGVDTRNQSFEWMLNNPAFAPALEWLFHNLDGNNVLTVREKRRFSEIEKKNKARGVEISSNEVEENIASIKVQYPGICLPGDQEAVEEVKMDVVVQKDRLNLLDKQELVIKDLMKQNELTNEQLNLEITKLTGAQQQAADEEKSYAEECLGLAAEVETLTEEVTEVVGNTMEMYANCGDKEIASKFYTFGPFEQYKQSQDLFQSHFDLYTSKKFTKKQNECVTDDNYVLNEAKGMEERLSDAISAFIESKAELSGEQAKLELVANYNHPHSSQISSNIMEAQSAVQLLEQEEAILEQQIQNAIKEFVEERTSIVEETAATAALAVREEIHDDLTFLLDTTHQALSLDRIIYSALRHELHNIEEFLHFASQLRQYVVGEYEAVASRIDSMNEICDEQASCEQKLQESDVLMDALCKILGVQSTNDALILWKLYNDLQTKISELKDSVYQGYDKRKCALEKFKESTKPLIAYIWDGCTKQPNCTDTTVASLTHKLCQEMDVMDKRIVEASGRFNTIKNGDKQQIRKLWQWFLTDPSRLLSAMKTAQVGG